MNIHPENTEEVFKKKSDMFSFIVLFSSPLLGHLGLYLVFDFTYAFSVDLFRRQSGTGDRKAQKGL